ncbi:MAG: hypothetical protein HY332_24985 [Chloroflexi bacterium]|nr:hypothetical protein [Chloroflexota bacterium]
MLFAQSEAEPPETWAKEVEVWISSTDDESQMTRAGRWTLAQTAEPQEFGFARATVRRVRLRILTNYGSAAYTSLDEFALLQPKM